MKVTLVKDGLGFMPHTEDDLNAIAVIPPGQTFVLELRTQRNPHFHRYAFKMWRILYDMIDEPVGFEPWRRLMTIKAGYFDTIGKVSVNGATTVAVVPMSMAFESMDEDYFREVFEGIHRAFCDKYGKLLTLQQLEQWVRM